MKKQVFQWAIQDGKRVVTRAFIFGNYDDSFAAYSELFDEAKKDFPDLQASGVALGKVRDSGYMDNFICISFLLPEQGDAECYQKRTRFDFRY